MSDLAMIPLQDGFETQLSQEWDGAIGTLYVLATPSYTPTTTDTYVIASPGKTNMQIARVSNYDSTAKTLTVDSISFNKALGISSTAQTHPTGSKVIISDNYQFWADIQTAIASKQDIGGGNATVYATTAARDSALGADGAATKPYTDVYVTATGFFYNYNLSANAWQVQGTSTPTGNASSTSAGSVEIATSAESIAGTDTGATGAKLSVLPSDQAKNIQSGTFEYGVDVGGDDTYVVALTPALTTYTTGQELKAKMTTANTGACTIDFGPGAKSVKLQDGTDPTDGLIGAGKIHSFVYDGTNLILQNPIVTLDGLDSFTAGAAITAGNALHLSPYCQTDGGITYDNKASSGLSNATNPTLALTVGSGTNRLLLVHVLHNISVTAVTYNGVAMTLVDTQAGSGGGFTIALYRLYAPSTGANSIAVTGSGIFGIAAISYSNVLQATGVEASAKGTTSASITTLTQGAVVYSAGGYYGSSGGTFSGGFTAGTKYSSSATFINAIGPASSPFYISGGDTGKINETSAFVCNNGSTNTGGGTPGWATITVSIAPATAVSLGVVPTITTQATVNEPLIDFIGFAQSTVAIGATVGVYTAGVMTGLSGLTAGLKYYLTSSNGALSATRGIYGKLVGVALSTTTLLIAPEKTMGSAIAKTANYTYTAECDGFVINKCSGSNTIITDGVTFTGVANANMSIPVSRKKTYIISTGATDNYFIPLA